MIHPTKRLREKNHRIISINSGKTLNKIQYQFMKKLSENYKWRGTLSKTIQLTSYFIVKANAFLLRLGTK